MLSSLCPPQRCCPPSFPPTSAYFDVLHSACRNGKWNPKTAALVLLTIGTLNLFLLKFFMKQTDGALKQDCRGVYNKYQAAERWDLEFVFKTPQKVFSNTTKKITLQEKKQWSISLSQSNNTTVKLIIHVSDHLAPKVLLKDL